MPCTGDRFDPLPNETLDLGQRTYVIRPHPRAPTTTFAATGRRATVYNLLGPGDTKWALKVFKRKFQVPSLMDSAKLVGRFRHLPGMTAAQRTVIGPKFKAVINCRDLLYSTLMPWIEGTTWYDMLLTASKHPGPQYDLRTSLGICGTFLKVMEGLEQAGVTHTDIAPGNVSVNLATFDVQLLDLEDIYSAGIPEPEVKNTGSPGYCHPSGIATWCTEGDRYATAVMAAEMLLLACPDTDGPSGDSGVFAGDRNTTSGTLRFNATFPYLQSVGPDFAELFRSAWMSKTLKDCPLASQLSSAIAKVPLPPPTKPPKAVMTSPKPVVKWIPPSPPSHTSSTQPKPQPQNPTGINPASWSGRTTPPPVKPPKPPPPPPLPKRLSGFQWALIVLASILLLGGLIWALVEHEATLTSEQRDLQRFSDYVTRLNAWKAQMSPNVISIRVKNECAQDSIRVAIRFRTPDETDRWVTMGWWSLAPGGSVLPSMATKNGVVYLYGYGEDSRLTWSGNHELGSVSAKVLDHQFVLLDGDDLSQESPREVSMFRRQWNQWGEHSVSLNCPVPQNN